MDPITGQGANKTAEAAATLAEAALADSYAFGFNHPDRYWEVVSSEDRTDAMLQQETGDRA
jgi:hypothetical protein